MEGGNNLPVTKHLLRIHTHTAALLCFDHEIPCCLILMLVHVDLYFYNLNIFA